MRWELSSEVSLRNERIRDEDADRQQRTAAEILRRLDDQPGVVLADEVGMGKTYVALAVAVSVLQASRSHSPIVIMVPTAVAEKWPSEWAVFAERCLPPGHGIRASAPVRRGGEFIKLVHAGPTTRPHLIFLTHGALTNNLKDPFIRLALLRRAMLWQPGSSSRRRPVARAAATLFYDRGFDEDTTSELLEAPTSQWLVLWNRRHEARLLEDPPVPAAFDEAVRGVDLTPVREALAALPVNRNASYTSRVSKARRPLNRALNKAWTEVLGTLDVHLPLLILDEAHHVKNSYTRKARLFANEEAERDAEALQRGALGNMFERMLFLTATPFQLGHHELLQVLDRFHGIRWASAHARARFDAQLADLRASLDRAQASALRFERAWARVDAADAPTVSALDSFEAADHHTDALRTALSVGAEAKTDIATAEALLKPWVIRHVKPHKGERRRYLPGRSILDDTDSDGELGLSVTGGATLPFLLAARAQAVASLGGPMGERSTQAYFAYGLASSFEAYADTRRNRIATLDDAVDDASPIEVSKELRWYLDRVASALPDDTTEGWAAHPKVAATVDRVVELWRRGEKALVFCFYVETGRALRAHISRALRHEIVTRAAVGLKLPAAHDAEILDALDALADRLLRSDSRGYQALRSEVERLSVDIVPELQGQLAEIVIRFMRTPSFLVRFVDIRHGLSVDDLIAGFQRPDPSGSSLASRVEALARTVAELVEAERVDLVDALRGTQTGSIRVTADDFDPSERSRHREMLLPNVRLANGGVRPETRRRLMLTFNTPFFPEVLVASSVMAEGVDLHQECRHVIHHDLDWNPSTLEQRTGRVGSTPVESGTDQAAGGDLRAVPRRHPRREDVPSGEGQGAVVRRRDGRDAAFRRDQHGTTGRSRAPSPRPCRAAHDGSVGLVRS
jgi:hypothetical protein